MSIFQLKQFSINQDITSMKVGTDGLLLGAWITKNTEVSTILDIGTGTGLIALMLAQKFQEASIIAIDIDEAAVLQAKGNAENTVWKNRIHIQHIALQDFIVVNKKKYDVISCNPPYFIKGWKIDNEQRKKARDAEHMPFEYLIEAAIKFLSDKGSFNLILPVEEGKKFITLMSKAGLFCKRKTTIYTKEGKTPKRFLVEIVKYPCETINTDLLIENKGLNNYTEEYKQLTRDFYLHF